MISLSSYIHEDFKLSQNTKLKISLDDYHSKYFTRDELNNIRFAYSVINLKALNRYDNNKVVQSLEDIVKHPDDPYGWDSCNILNDFRQWFVDENKYDMDDEQFNHEIYKIFVILVQESMGPIK